MKLKSVLDTLDGLDDALKGYYTEKDGAYILNVDGVTEHPEAKNVKTALDKERQKNKDLQAKIEAFPTLPDDFSVDEYNRLKDGGSGNVDQKLESQRNRLTAEKDASVKKVSDERDLYKNMVTQMAIDASVNTALAESNITIPAYQNAARAMFGSKAKVDFEDGKPVVTIDNLPVGEKIKAYAASDEGKYLVTAPNNGGGGSGNSQNQNAVAYDKMTMTELSQRASKGDAQAQKEIDRQTKIELPKR